MKIITEQNKIVGFVKIGVSEGGIEINESILPENFFSEWYSEKFLYIGGEIIENPDFVPPKPKPTLDDQIAALQEQNQMLTDCLLEMSEIVYGGDM